ncbi:hypothetical protein MOK15_07580 [Sphingobium sp. BYY-5]|uniref:hypothetical protein n=1 Tax=Sphingobium sp. BYY-5 TaxID=2926400 RepID=UPI001FA7FD30|nr:hypothetical protein [Sphingobium sp. BYY-5]MCI4589951.1 hypothetical protein [Sphingobium sp. BYY-5]
MLGTLIKLMAAILAGASPANPLDIPVELVKPEVAVAQVAACGVKSVRLKFDDTLQEDVIEVEYMTSASEEQLRCVAHASLASHYYVVFPSSIERAYQALYRRLSNEQDRTVAKAWLEKRGLLSRLPVYDPQHLDEAAFVRELEAMCGPKAIGTVKVMHGMGTFEGTAISSGKLDDETFWCLVNGAAASGYPFGFIGNEKYGENP